MCKYTLSVVEVTNKTTFIPRITAFENDATISYTLPANGRYSTAFEVETAAGATDIMNFSEILNMVLNIVSPPEIEQNFSSSIHEQPFHDNIFLCRVLGLVLLI